MSNISNNVFIDTLTQNKWKESQHKLIEDI